MGSAIDKAPGSDLYVSGGNLATQLDPQGNRTTFAMRFNTASGMAFDSAGNLSVASFANDGVGKNVILPLRAGVNGILID